MKSQSFHFGATHRSSDSIDFNDVFGGPPMRFSPRDVRGRIYVDEIEDSEDERSSMPTKCSKEKPVFGEMSSNSRRHNSRSEDFFNDIYRGDDSFNSPRNYPDGDSGSSRFMSPAEISTPKPKFSVPPKFDEGNEVPGFSNRWGDGSTSGISSPSSSLRFQNRIFQGYEDESSLIYRSLPYSATPEKRRNSGRIRNETRIVNGDIDFHFSFYKWASNGIPVLKLLTILDGRCSKSRKADVAVGAHEFLKTGRVRKGARKQREATKHLKDFFQEALGEVYGLKMRGDNDEMKKSVTSKVAKEIGVQIFNELKATAADEENDVRVDKLGTRGKIELVETFSLYSESRGIDDVLREIKDSRTEAVHSGKSRNAASTNAPKEADHESYHSSKMSENRKSMQEEEHVMAACSSEVPPQADPVPSPERDIDPFEVNFLVEVLSDEFENLYPLEKVENTKEIDAKVRQWSAGKKGNIQSLLSTLQFVLWPESGWKPVPLVNLLEANSVKRAYQKAMLQLHPDKLQQKNASFHHKYLAEKVFEIIQEAWDHFNTLSHV